MLWFSSEAPRRGASNEYHTYFCWSYKKTIMYQKKLGLAKAGLNCGVVLFLTGLNSGILL